MIAKLNSSRCATFYRKIKTFPTNAITRMFTAVSANKIGNYKEKIIRKEYRLPLLCHVSFLVYCFEEEPSFLKGSRLRENKFAFLLIVETEKYIVISKKHIFGIDEYIEKYCSPIEYQAIQYLYSDQSPQYEKMSLTNMGICKSSIRKRTLESNDLKGQLGAVTSRRSIPTTTTIKTKNHRHILRPSNSSISKSDSKSSIKDFLVWISDICKELEKGNQQNDFLDTFAQAVEFDNLKNQSLVPTAVSLNLSGLKEILTTDSELNYGEKVISEEGMTSLLTKLEETFLVEKNGDEYQIILEKTEPVYRKKTYGKLRINENSISLRSPWLSKIHLSFEGWTGTLQKYINNFDYFLLTFQKPDFAYLNKTIFQDRGIKTHLNEIRNALNALSFSNINSEKGDFSSNQSSFSSNSIFGYLESNLINPSSKLICDDLGDEWADFIEINKDEIRITLWHCKHGSMSTSASKLHDVIGQALKNIGRLSVTKNELTKKSTKWKSVYKNDSQVTQIKRIRSNHTVEEVIDRMLANISHHSYKREIAIVTPFLLKQELESAFSVIESNTNQVKPHFVQLIWLLTTFISTCKETGIIPRIYCSP